MFLCRASCCSVLVLMTESANSHLKPAVHLFSSAFSVPGLMNRFCWHTDPLCEQVCRAMLLGLQQILALAGTIETCQLCQGDSDQNASAIDHRIDCRPSPYPAVVAVISDQ